MGINLYANFGLDQPFLWGVKYRPGAARRSLSEDDGKLSVERFINCLVDRQAQRVYSTCLIAGANIYQLVPDVARGTAPR